MDESEIFDDQNQDTNQEESGAGRERRASEPIDRVPDRAELDAESNVDFGNETGEGPTPHAEPITDPAPSQPDNEADPEFVENIEPEPAAEQPGDSEGENASPKSGTEETLSEPQADQPEQPTKSGKEKPQAKPKKEKKMPKVSASPTPKPAKVPTPKSAPVPKPKNPPKPGKAPVPPKAKPAKATGKPAPKAKDSTKPAPKPAKVLKPGEPRVKAAPGMTALGAAAKILKAAKGKSMSAKELVEKSAAQNLWESMTCKDPPTALFRQMSIEIEDKGPKVSRFVKTGKGLFAYNQASATVTDPITGRPIGEKAKDGKKAAGKNDATKPTNASKSAAKKSKGDKPGKNSTSKSKVGKGSGAPSDLKPFQPDEEPASATGASV